MSKRHKTYTGTDRTFHADHTLAPADKCPHGVYKVHGAAYCTLCVESPALEFRLSRSMPDLPKGGVIMGKDTGIEWCTATWNPWYGCHKVSPACAHCYAEREMTRYGKNFDVVTRAKDATFFAPLKWKEPRKIFTCSWSDFFIAEADAWRAEAWNVVMQTPQHTYQVLTKRPERIGKSVLQWPSHAWLGVSVETTRQYGRIDRLREIPAAIRFLSMEPLLSETRNTNLGGIHWVIVGTESGPQARPTNYDWIRRIRDKCKDEGVAFFVKQLTTQGGIKIPFEMWPEDLRVREFPSEERS